MLISSMLSSRTLDGLGATPPGWLSRCSCLALRGVDASLMLTSSRFFAPRGTTLGIVLSIVAPSFPIAIVAAPACGTLSTAAVRQRGAPALPHRPNTDRPSRNSGSDDARSGFVGLGVRPCSSVASVALAAPALARSSPSIAEWLSESCESAPSRWSLLDPRVLEREQLTEQSLSQCLRRRATGRGRAEPARCLPTRATRP
jgi:hypothetical protein